MCMPVLHAWMLVCIHACVFLYVCILVCMCVYVCLEGEGKAFIYKGVIFSAASVYAGVYVCMHTCVCTFSLITEI